jgi:hypothetical protein
VELGRALFKEGGQILPRRPIQGVEHPWPIDRYVSDRTLFSYKTFASVSAAAAEVVGTTAGEGVSVAVAAMLASPVWEISGRASGEGVAAGSPSLIRTH